MNPLIFGVLELSLFLGAGAGLGFGWGWVESGYGEVMKRRLRWFGAMCLAWSAVLGLMVMGFDGPWIRGFVFLNFFGLVAFSTRHGPSSLHVIRSVGISGNLILLFNGLILSAVLAGVLDYVDINVTYGSWQMYALIPVGVFIALRVHGLRMMANTLPE